MIEVYTQSGNVYYLRAIYRDYDQRPLFWWTVKEPRDLDETGKAEGVVIYGPEVGKSLTLVWIGPDGRLKVRVTSLITRVEGAYDAKRN